MRIGLLGAGNIGFGVYEIGQYTDGVDVIKVLDKRDIPELRDLLTTDPDSILEDPSIDTIVELLGGVEPAFGWVEKALLSGKNVVTANKLLVSEKMPELLAAARKGGAELRFSAAVGGGIPILLNLLRARRVDAVQETGGVLNGTTNYILTKMQEDHLDFETALKQAQELGYAEANPDADVSGKDTHCKIMLAACIAWNGLIHKNEILREGITNITPADLDKSHAMGYICRLMARAVDCGKGLAITVEPTLVKKESVPANIRLVENMGYWQGANAGMQRFTGAGAGRYATAYAVIEDVLDLNGSGNYSFDVSDNFLTVDQNAIARQYLVRGLDLPGEKDGDYVLTDAVSPAVVHAAAEQARAEGKKVFLAGLFD